jgi:hypothetical protein
MGTAHRLQSALGWNARYTCTHGSVVWDAYGFGMAGEDASKSKTPKSAKLPAKSLAEALEIAQTLKDYAASASKAVIAEQSGTTTSSSAFKSKLASAGYYGLTEKDGDKFKLSSRGEAVLDGDDIAKRTAVMSTGFGPIIASLPTRQVSENVISIIQSRLKSDHGATESSAETLASVLVKSAEDSGLIANERFDAQAIESVDSEEIGPKAPSKKAAPSSADTSKKSSSAQKKTPPAKEPKHPDPPNVEHPVVEQTPIQVIVQVDGSKMDPAKITELVKLLRSTD